MEELRAVDCQGFAGGFTLGTVEAGFKLVGKREMSAGFGVPNCEAQRHLLGYEWNVESVDPAAWSVPSGGAEFVFGNPPCSGFSGLSSKHFRGIDSPINHCMWAFVEYAARVQPLVAVFESVRAAYTKGHPLMRDLRARLEARTGMAWTLHHVVHDAYALGGPAIRRRYFWVAARIPFGVEHPEVPVEPTLWHAIGDLEALELTEKPQPYVAPPTPWSGRLRSPAGLVDGHYTLKNPHAERITQLADMIEWPQGKNVGYATRACYEKHGRLPDAWRATEQAVVDRNFEFGFSGSTSRWPYARPARVVTGAGANIALHPVLNRMTTFREVARIMGFPDDWLIEPLVGNPGMNATWGKGITVDAGRWIARWVRSSIEGNPGTLPSEQVGSREFEVTVSKPRVRDTVAAVQTTTMMRGTDMSNRQEPEARPAPEVPVFTTAAPQFAVEAAQEAEWQAASVPRIEPGIEVDQLEEVEAEVHVEPPTEDGSVDNRDRPRATRGKGQPTAVVDRANAVLDVLVDYPEGLTREQLADNLRDVIEPDDEAKRSTRVYQSLVWLSWEQNGAFVERVRDGRTHIWRLASK